jgi:glycogen(starch) synthase
MQMGIPSVTTNLSGFGCFMQDLIDRPESEGCYIVDRRLQSVEESVNQLTEYMFTFCGKTRRQRINQRNRVERLSPLLDWKNLGVEYSKSRQLALRRAYPDAFSDVANDGENEGFEFGSGIGAISTPASPRLRGVATPGDLGTLTEEVRPYALLVEQFRLSKAQMQSLETSDYRGYIWPGLHEDEENGYPLWVTIQTYPLHQLTTFCSPLVMKFRSRRGSVVSGASTPGGIFKSLSEGDLQKADAALNQVNGVRDVGAP